MASGLRVPQKQAAHMAAPTEGQNIKKALAKGEPSTHGAKQTLGSAGTNDRFGEKRTFQHRWRYSTEDHWRPFVGDWPAMALNSR